MAVIRHNILGKFQGDLSNVVFRVRNGKLVAYTKPAKQRVSKSKAAVDARKKFAITVALAKEINSDPLLATIWKYSNIKATNGYQKIIKVNSKLSESGLLTVNNKITPDSDILPDFETSLDESKLFIRINCDGIEKDLLIAPRLYYLIFYYNPLSKKSDCSIQLNYVDLPDLSQSNDYNLSIKIKERENYRNAIILLAITKQTYSEKKDLIWSKTVGIQLF